MEAERNKPDENDTFVGCRGCATGAALKGGFAVEASEAPLRYALELTKDSADGVYSLWATETTARDLRISNLRIERSGR